MLPIKIIIISVAKYNYQTVSLTAGWPANEQDLSEQDWMFSISKLMLKGIQHTHTDQNELRNDVGGQVYVTFSRFYSWVQFRWNRNSRQKSGNTTMLQERQKRRANAQLTQTQNHKIQLSNYPVMLKVGQGHQNQYDHVKLNGNIIMQFQISPLNSIWENTNIKFFAMLRYSSFYLL